MQYDVTLFRNSGFNATNIPDSPELLISLADSKAIGSTVLKGELKSLQINQDVQLDALTVRCSLSQAKNVDFVMLDDNDTNTGKKFYAVIDRHMDAEDVCTFTVQQSCLLSYGGVNGLDILDGITERVHVGDDSKFYACEGDPLLNPAEPLEITEEWITAEESNSRNDRMVFAECLVDPVNTLKSKEAVEVFYKDIDPDTQQEVTKSAGGYPAVKHPDQPTYFGIDNNDPVNKAVTAGTTLYIVSGVYSLVPPISSDLFTKEAIDNIQALGIAQGAIINQYEIPKGLYGVIEAKAPHDDTAIQSQVTYIGRVYNYFDLVTIPAKMNKTFKNKLVEYSPIQKFGMMTAAGNSAEFNLEDLRHDGSVVYTIAILSDPRPDGRPYFRPKYVNGVLAGGSGFRNFWRNAIAGMGWKKVPLVYQGASGSALNTQKFENSQAIEAINRKQEVNNQQWGLINTAFKGLAQGLKGAVEGNALTGIGGVFGSTLSFAQQVENNRYTQQGYTAEKIRDVYDLYAANNIVAPTVNFPYSSDAIRDTSGNGVLCYQYSYTEQDAKRIDKLLTMYGYRVAKPLEKKDFTNRQYFNYVACRNVSVTGHSQWVNDAIARELQDGVRVWHVLPNKSYYTSGNPII